MARNSKKVSALIDLLYQLETDALDVRRMIQLLRGFPYKKTLKTILIFAYTPTIQFEFSVEFFKDLATSKRLVDADDRLELLLKNLNKVVIGKITKRLLFKRLSTSLNNSSTEELELYRRILKRRIGLSQEMVLTAFPKLVTNPTTFMEAECYAPNIELSFPLIAEPFINGARIKLIASPSGEFFAYNQGYTPYTDLFRFYRAGMLKFAQIKDSVVELDCIVTAPKDSQVLTWFNSNFHHMATYCCPAQGSERFDRMCKSMHLYAIDCSVKTLINRKLKLRKRDMIDMILLITKMAKREHNAARNKAEEAGKQLAALPKLEPLPFVELERPKQVHKAFLKANKQGYDGIVLKLPASPYVAGKSSLWLKYKVVARETVKILEVIPNQTQSTCAALIVKRNNGSKFMLTGISESQKPILWDNRSYLLGSRCEIEATESNSFGTEGQVRLVKFRWDKQA